MSQLSQNPTVLAYQHLAAAYVFFNEKLFSAELPYCLITMQRKNNSYGYFSGDRFCARDKTSTTDEIALNPRHFGDRSIEEIFATLVHEMVHLKQHHNGTQSRGGYHNADWAQMMREVGLIPSSTGRLGGKETGQKVSHFIEKGGRFALACSELIDIKRLTIPYVEIIYDDDRVKRSNKVKSKTKYTCECCGANAWAKPGTKLECGKCHITMQVSAMRGRVACPHSVAQVRS